MDEQRPPAAPTFRGRSTRQKVLVVVAVAVVLALVLPFLPVFFG